MGTNAEDAIVAAPRGGFPMLRRVQSALDQLDVIKPVGAPFDPSDLTRYSDARLVAIANEYDKSVLLAEQQLRQVEQQIEGLKRANRGGEFLNDVERRLYEDLLGNAEVLETQRMLGLHKMYQMYDEVMTEVRRRNPAAIGGAFEYCVAGAAVGDGYEGIDSLEKLRADVAETTRLTPIGKQAYSESQKEQLIQDHVRQIRNVRSALRKRQEQRVEARNIMRQKGRSSADRAEARALLRDIEASMRKLEKEKQYLLRRIRAVRRGTAPQFNSTKKMGVADMPNVPTHVIKGRVGFYDDDDDDEEEWLEAIGFKLGTWAKDKKQDYKSRLEKYTKPGSATGDDGMTVRQKEERRRKEAKRRVAEAKRTAKKGERERKAGKRQAERAARQQRQQGVRAARQEERALKKTVKKRTSAQTRAAKKEFDAARRRYQAQTKRAKQAASKELKQARQQRLKKAHREKQAEREGLSRARKTFKPQKGAKKDVRRAEKDKKAVFAERDKRIKFQRRAEAWKKRLHGDVDRAPKDSGPAPPDALVSDAPFPSGRDVADALFAAAQVSTFGPDPYDHDGIDDDDGDMGDEEEYAADAILGHLPPECAEDEDVVRMVEGYVGAWVSAAIGSEVCEVASGLGLSTDDVRDILDMHAKDIAERLEPELGDRWMDFHETTAGLMDDPDALDEHALAASELLIGGRDAYTYAWERRYAPYAPPVPRRRYYLDGHDRRPYFLDHHYEPHNPRPAPARYTHLGRDAYADQVDWEMRGQYPRRV